MNQEVSTLLAAMVIGASAGGGLAAFLASRRLRDVRAQAGARLEAAERRLALASASAELFTTATILVEDGRPSLFCGRRALTACAATLGTPAEPAAVIQAIAHNDDDHGRRLHRLFADGVACAFTAMGAEGGVLVEGRASGALAWLRLSLAESGRDAKSASGLAAFVDAYAEPAWIAAADGSPLWANRAWLSAVEAASLDQARLGGLTIDRGADALARNASASAEPRERVRWLTLGGRRRALLIRAAPLVGGETGVWTTDVTQLEAASETLRRQIAAHESTLGQIGDAVVAFGRDRRLIFHNPAFARLWDLEPAWLADGPGHGEVLDRLRQRRRLPETMDYARFKAQELARYEQAEGADEAIWRLPDERTLRVAGQPHPLGGLVMVFSDVTPELRLKAQFNHLIQVQRATLDKLTDAVAVFGPDARLQLHNEAFARFWNVDRQQLGDRPSFDAVVELCIPRVHDLQFWRDLKGRIADPDPRARAPVEGEVTTTDGRIVAWQSRPLPDGATLTGFADVTDTRRLEGALRDREAALSQAERLKRDFVGSVSYELRTPLTTILGFAELLERRGEALGDQLRGYVGAVKTAAGHLARSIENVLNVAEIDAGEMLLDPTELDVGALLAGAAGRWQGEASAAGVVVTVDAASAGGPMVGDPARLAQVLDHLTRNALRHTPIGGCVTLSAQRAVGEVRLQVSDTGRGIPFHVQAHIFDRFSGEDRGAPGLGLALVKALVELHGGWVAVESEPGAGASFTCHLPDAAHETGANPSATLA